MTKSGKLFYDELTEWLLEEGFIPSQYQMSIYYKSAPYGTKIVVLSYVGDCVNLTVRVNTTKLESQRAQLEHYFLGCVS